MPSCCGKFAPQRKMGSTRLCHKKVGQFVHWSLMKHVWGSSTRCVAQSAASTAEVQSQNESTLRAAQAEDAYGASKIQVRARTHPELYMTRMSWNALARPVSGRCGFPLSSDGQVLVPGTGGVRAGEEATWDVHRKHRSERLASSHLGDC